MTISVAQTCVDSDVELWSLISDSESESIFMGFSMSPTDSFSDGAEESEDDELSVADEWPMLPLLSSEVDCNSWKKFKSLLRCTSKPAFCESYTNCYQ